MNIKYKDSNIIGEKFGKLTPIKRVDIKDKNNINRIHYDCECDCGNNKLIYKDSIIRGDAPQSCGCDKKVATNKKSSKNPLQNLVGKTFNRLTVIKQVEKPEHRKNRARYWLCKCECGSDKEVIATTGELNSNNTKSCGCQKIESTIKFNKETKKKYNTYDLSQDFGVGYTTKNEEFYFDLEDYDKIKEYCWRIGNRGYVMCTINYPDKKYDLLFHRLIMNCPDDKEVDHINGIATRHDNRKYNLRVCSHQKNMCNYTIPKNNTSGVKGVSYDNRHQTWKAYITSKGNRVNLGSFNNFDDAVLARKEAEKIYHGQYRWKGDDINY